jgi:hypothetical protein
MDAIVLRAAFSLVETASFGQVAVSVGQTVGRFYKFQQAFCAVTGKEAASRNVDFDVSTFSDAKTQPHGLGFFADTIPLTNPLPLLQKKREN